MLSSSEGAVAPPQVGLLRVGLARGRVPRFDAKTTAGGEHDARRRAARTAARWSCSAVSTFFAAARIARKPAASHPGGVTGLMLSRPVVSVELDGAHCHHLK